MLEVDSVVWSRENPQTFVDVAPDLTLPRSLRVASRGGTDYEFDFEMGVVFDEVLMRYVASDVRVERVGAGREISNANLRTLRVQEVLQRAALQVLRIESRDGDALPFPLPADTAARVAALGPSSPEAQLWTARIYSAALICNLPPAKEVQSQLGLSAPTASVWIRRCRDRGLLPPATGRTRDDDGRMITHVHFTDG